MKNRSGFAILVLFWLFAWPPHGHAEPPPHAGRKTEPVAATELVTVQRGTLPIILSVPHGGGADIPGAQEKEAGTSVRDWMTAEIGALVLQFITEELGEKPYLVKAQFSRRYIDANRGPTFLPDEAYGDDVAKVHWQAYHRALREFVDEVRENHGTGILIDLHGQSGMPEKMVRGTFRGLSVKRLLDRHGLKGLLGEHSVFGQLHARGYPVEPPVNDAPDSPEDEQRYYRGYIIQAYGSHQPDGIDAILLEIGRDHRQESVRRQTALDVAKAIIAHYRAFVLAPPNPSQRPPDALGETESEL